MTDENPWAADTRPPVEGYGYGGWARYEEPRRSWYRAPGSLIGAATFSAIFAWITVAIIAGGFAFSRQMESMNPLEALFVGIFAIMLLDLFFVAGLATFCLAVAGAVATVPLAIAWWRGADHSPGALAALSSAAVSWVVLITLVFRLGLTQAFP